MILVNWEEAKGYVAWLKRVTGKEYRLLTEAEWEYAARAGSPARYSFGDAEAQLGEHAWFSGNSETKTHPVGKKKPNAFGLHDMHGNVWEWVEDAWHDNYKGAPLDGSAWLQNRHASRHVVRGGSWNFAAVDDRSANRFGPATDYRGIALGFRVGRTLSP